VPTMTHMERVGIRELRQNLSRYAKRVRAGESFIVTDRGEEIGLFAPSPKRMDPLDRLEAEGRLVQRGRGNLIEALERLGPIPSVGSDGITLMEAVEEQRRSRY